MAGLLDYSKKIRDELAKNLLGIDPAYDNPAMAALGGAMTGNFGDAADITKMRVRNVFAKGGDSEYKAMFPNTQPIDPVSAGLGFAPMGVGVIRGINTGLPKDMLVEINKGRGLLGKVQQQEITNKFFPLAENQMAYQNARSKVGQLNSDINSLIKNRSHEISGMGFESHPYMRDYLKKKGAVSTAVDILKTTPATFEQSYFSALRDIEKKSAILQKDASDKLLKTAMDDAFKSPITPYFHKKLADKIKQEVEFQHLLGQLNRRGAANIDVEGKTAVLEAITREAKKRGATVDYISAKSSQSGGSHYIKSPNGKIFRISDHELPDTPQREFNRSQGLTGRWDDEILLNDWRNTGMEDYMEMIFGNKK